jgi:dienelactone hydrolase
MRLPWARSNDRFIRSWLVAGAFPGGLNDDFLAAQGGEPAMVPTDRLETKYAGSTSVKWHPLTSWGDAVGLDFPGAARDGAVAYAFAKVTPRQAGKSLLSFGSDGGVRVWLNGKLVLSRDGQRTLAPDEDQVEVDLNAGDNSLLVKVLKQAESWAFSVRIIETGTVLPRTAEIYPAIVTQDRDGLTVKTDNGNALAAERDVTVEVVAPGGRILAAKTAHRGDSVSFNSRNWPDGPYEARCSTRTFDGRSFTTHVPWYKGDCLAKARELGATALKADATTPEGFTLRMLADMVEDRLGSKIADAKGNPWEKIHSPLMEYDELMLERQGRQGRIRPYGFLRLAYRDEVDGSPQFCRAYLPARYDPARKWPVVIDLHGYNPQNPVYVRWWAASDRHSGYDTEPSDGRGFIFMAPHGRGNASYIGMGDSDVVRALAEAKRLLNVDDDRVYLMGESMGGWGTWNIATRHPDLFAAISPIFGGSDYHAEMSEEDLARLDPVARFLSEKRSSWAMADGLLNVPVLVHQGDADKAVNADYSRWGVRLLQRWGYDVRYHEYPGRGHEQLFDAKSAIKNIEWFLDHRRDPGPAHVRIRSAELRHASAYWAHVDQMASPMAFMVLDAEVIGSNLIRLDTENVLALTLSPPAALVDAGKPLRVVWNGAQRSSRLQEGRLHLAAAGFEPAPLHKNERIPGTIQDFTVTPFAVVVGTISKDPEMVEICAKKAAGFAAYWRDWQKQELRVFKDTELTDNDMTRYSLLLIGGPEANKVSAVLERKMPLRISPDQIVVDGKSFVVKDAAVRMIYPNPLNADRYILIAAGTSAGGMYYCDLLNQEQQGWDYVIDDGRIPPFKQKAFGHQIRVVSGMFDYNWRYDRSLATEGDAQIRAKGRQLLRPKANLTVDPKVLDAYVGRYQIEKGSAVSIVREGKRLLAKGDGLSVEMLPLSETDFRIEEYSVQLTLVRDGTGKIVGFSGYQNGEDFMVTKVD